jgi:hypothetical protein
MAFGRSSSQSRKAKKDDNGDTPFPTKQLFILGTFLSLMVLPLAQNGRVLTVFSSLQDM